MTITTPTADLIEEHRAWLQAGGFSRRTAHEACKLLARVDAETPHGLAHALPHELVRWLAQGDGRDWAPSTTAAYRQHLRRFYVWACDPDDQVLDYDPSITLRKPKIHRPVPDPATDEQVRLCVTATVLPWRLHCILAAYAGLRPVEIAALQREDVTEELVRINRGKGWKPAVVPCEPAVWRAVRDLPPGPVTRKRSGPATAAWVSIHTAGYLRNRAHIQTNLRRLRHWHCTWLQRHHPIRVVQERMRHASIQTTQGYAAVTSAELAASRGTLPDFDAPGGVS